MYFVAKSDLIGLLFIESFFFNGQPLPGPSRSMRALGWWKTATTESIGREPISSVYGLGWSEYSSEAGG